MGIDLGKFENLITKLAGDPKAENDFFDDSASAPNPYVLVAARAVFVKLKPVLDASLAKKLVAIIALFCFTGDLEANLAENKPGEFLADFESSDAIRVIAYRPQHY
jgi:hypothetical protein